MGIARGTNIITDNLKFGYDTGYGVADNHTATRFYKGKPSSNTWSKNTHSYTSGNITATRNATPPIPPPVEGFEVYKLVSNDGALNQGIMGTSAVVNGVGGDYVHSVYCYLESGTTVTVGQHWNPWAYGSSQTPPVGKWVRLSQTVTNATSNYGAIANAYRTNGTAYFTAPQYELGSVVTPHVDGTRSSTGSLTDLARAISIDVSNISFDSTGQPTFDGTDDHIALGASSQFGIARNVTIEAVVKRDSAGWNGIFGRSDGGSFIHFQLYGETVNVYFYGPALACVSGNVITSTSKYYHIVATFDGSSAKIYVDGSNTTTTSNGNTSNISAADNVSVGKVYSSDRHFDGEIPVLKVYNSALTSSEILQNYNAYKNRFNL